MSVLKPTGPRLALMRAIVKARVVFATRKWAGDIEVKYDGRTVTRTYNDLRDAHLVTLGAATGPSIYSPKPVEPTEVGRSWLAEHDKEAGACTAS